VAPKIVFALAEGQNQFFVEVAETLQYELSRIGQRCEIVTGALPVPEAGVVNVLLPPHEYVTLSGFRPPRELLARSILISAEQPQSPFFGSNVDLAREAGAVFDINPRAVRAYREEKIDARLLALGYSSLWDAGDGTESPARDIDVLFMGRLTHRRAVALSSYAGVLERFHCHFLLSDNARPNTSTGTAFAAGEDKRRLLSRAKVLLNIHGEDEPYFEWLRVAEAVSAGCAVVSEHSTDMAPMVWGRDLLTGRLDSLGLLCVRLLDDEERRLSIAASAIRLLRDERNLADAARGLAEAAAALDAVPVTRLGVLRARQERARPRRSGLLGTEPLQPLERPLSYAEGLALKALKVQQLALMDLRRRFAGLTWSAAHDGRSAPMEATRVLDSPGWEAGEAERVSVIVPLYNHRRHVPDALDSLLRSTFSEWEVVVVDDASSDGGGEAVAAWIEGHPDRAARLIRHEVNRGLGAARNSGIAASRGAFLLMLDSDNEIRRRGLQRLVDALALDSGASFAYGIMERFSPNGPDGLMNTSGWEPGRLRIGNYIDAFSLIRREPLASLGGYSLDTRLYGWEDYDLWVRMAEAGRYGVFVPEILARYRVAHGSMISETNISTADAYAALADHAPKLMAGLRIPHSL
jgi:hypothetical protein